MDNGETTLDETCLAFPRTSGASNARRQTHRDHHTPVFPDFHPTSLPFRHNPSSIYEPVVAGSGFAAATSSPARPTTFDSTGTHQEAETFFWGRNLRGGYTRVTSTRSEHGGSRLLNNQ